MTLPRIGITMGDVNGIGPSLWRSFRPARSGFPCAPAVTAPGAPCAAWRNLPRACLPYICFADAPAPSGCIPVWDAGAPGPEVEFGQLNPAAGASAVAWIEAAVDACVSGGLDAMVTCPISKECIYLAGCPYTGHTELVADRSGAPDYRMCLFAGDMRIVHITGHLSLRDAIEHVRHDRIVRSVEIGRDALVRLGVASPRIGVASA